MRNGNWASLVAFISLSPTNHSKLNPQNRVILLQLWLEEGLEMWLVSIGNHHFVIRPLFKMRSCQIYVKRSSFSPHVFILLGRACLICYWCRLYENQFLLFNGRGKNINNFYTIYLLFTIRLFRSFLIFFPYLILFLAFIFHLFIEHYIFLF